MFQIAVIQSRSMAPGDADRIEDVLVPSRQHFEQDEILRRREPHHAPKQPLRRRAGIGRFFEWQGRHNYIELKGGAADAYGSRFIEPPPLEDAIDLKARLRSRADKSARLCR